ncbi:TPA: CDP-glycerol glycerophosphotransferase family protein, partial [Aeromonas veronii]
KFKHDVLFDKKFIFLQHGIICSDLSSAYNSSKIDLFITSGILEYKSIADSPSPYKLTSKEVKLTGLPRHDSLIRNDENITPDSIVIMPTWREYLVGKFVGDGLLRDSNDDFMSSEYALNWSMFLHSNGLKNYALEKKLKIKFFPHAEILPYIKQLDIPEYIDVVTSVDSSIQNVFHSSAIFITDFSSVGFEVGLLRKHILYFQFDYDEFFSNHSKKGYFDYKADGFGPVSYTTDELLENLYEIKSINLDQNSIYYKRQSTFFKYYDNNSCQRVYTSIKNLHSMDSIENTNLNTLKIYAKQAEKQNAWSLAQTRWERAHINKSHVTDGLENIKYIISLRKQGKLAQAEQFISEHYPINNTYQDSITHEKARIAMAKHEWLVAIQYWKKTTLEDFDCYLDYIQCLAELELTLEVDQAIKTSLHTHNHPCSKLVIVWSDIAKKQWKNAAKKLDLMIPACSRENLIKYKLQIVLARCLREQGLFIESHEKLQSFEKISKATILFREEAAQLAYAREYWDKVISQVKAAYVEPINMPYPIATILLKSLQLKASNIALIISENNSDEILSLKIKAYREQGKLNHAKHLVDSRLKVSSNKVISSEIFSESAQLAMDNYQWELALSYLDMINTRDDHTYILKIICFSELGSHKAIKRLTLDKNWFDKLDKTLSTFVHALYAIARRDWLQAERYLESSLLYANKKAIFDYKLELRLSRVKRELNQFNDAHALLVAYERHTTNDPKCREEIAKLAYSKCLWDKTISQLDKAYPNDIDYSESVALLMLSALEKKSQHERISTILMKMPQLNIRGYKKASSVVSRHNSNSTSPQTLIN